MVTKQPELWEDGQYLLERDPVHRTRYSEAAMKAQESKMLRLIANRAPQKDIGVSELAINGETPPLWRFGFPFKDEYALEYARRHSLKIEIVEADREAFDGREVLDFSETDDTWMEDEEIASFLICASRSLMMEDLRRRCGLLLEVGRPFTFEWDGLVSLWSNYDIREQFRLCGRSKYDKVIKILEEAMNEGKQYPDSFCEWWFDWNNDVASRAPLAFLLRLLIFNYRVFSGSNEAQESRGEPPATSHQLRPSVAKQHLPSTIELPFNLPLSPASAMSVKNPALWENGQYLMEGDPVTKNGFSEAALKAQASKMLRLMRNRAPRRDLRRSELALNGRKPPLWRFGFPFKRQYALEYARRHALTIKIAEADKDAFDGRDVLDFSETDDTWLEDKELAVFLKSTSEMLMVEDLSRKCGFKLRIGSPFTYDWDGLVALWSNYDIVEKVKECGRHNYDKVETILTEAMNEGKQHPDSFGEWWFDWNNEVGVFMSVN
uniref:Neutral alpha-glucosidase AB n=1 Tax=Ganoderma boninense TaxID=34458 RepID=A0A5K1K6I8_9APHY|nr:Neutral alpha-glucosidase AB [Ganoderma boninense]